jgi:hypothetical protein
VRPLYTQGGSKGVISKHLLAPRRNVTTSSSNLSKTKPSKSNKGRTKILQHDNPWLVSTTNIAGGYSLSELAGHASFVGVCVAYLNTDIFMLRLLSMGSISLSIIFQYYRAIPLWIPIRWNALLLGINTVMTVSLMLERQRADNMPPVMEVIYREGCFEKRGFNKVEFIRLFSVAKKIILKPGTRLASDGKENTRL